MIKGLKIDVKGSVFDLFVVFLVSVFEADLVFENAEGVGHFLADFEFVGFAGFFGREAEDVVNDFFRGHGFFSASSFVHAGDD